jgi:hypothetical protein
MTTKAKTFKAREKMPVVRADTAKYGPVSREVRAALGDEISDNMERVGRAFQEAKEKRRAAKKAAKAGK